MIVLAGTEALPEAVMTGDGVRALPGPTWVEDVVDEVALGVVTLPARGAGVTVTCSDGNVEDTAEVVVLVALEPAEAGTVITVVLVIVNVVVLPEEVETADEVLFREVDD